MIESYRFGQMAIDGVTHRRDLKIVGGRVAANWWRKEDHRLDTDDVEDILSAGPEILVVGTGHSGNMIVEESLRGALKARNIRMIAEPTAEAVNSYNKLVSEGKDVAAAFHLTC